VRCVECCVWCIECCECCVWCNECCVWCIECCVFAACGVLSAASGVLSAACGVLSAVCDVMSAACGAGAVLPNINPVDKTFCAVVQASADGKGHADYALSKRSMSDRTIRFCRRCNCTSANRSVPYDTANTDCPLLLTSKESHERDIELVGQYPELSPTLGESRSPLLGKCHNNHI